MNKKELRHCISLLKMSNMTSFIEDNLLAMLNNIDEEMFRNEEKIESARDDYNKAVKVTPLGENIPEYYEDFVEPYEDSNQFLGGKKKMINDYLEEIREKELEDIKAKQQEEKERIAFGDGTTQSGFYVKEDSPDDLTIYQNGKPILVVSIPEQLTQWNTNLP